MELLSKGPAPLCNTCTSPAAKMFQDAGIPILYYSDFITEAERRQIDQTADSLDLEAFSGFEWHGVPVGEHAKAGALRYFGSGSLEKEASGPGVLRRYLKASMQSVTVMENLLRSSRFDRAVFHHGIYVPQGPIGDVCRRANVPVINWNLAYRDRSVLFSHGDTYHRSMIGETNELWEQLPFEGADEIELTTYLKSRRSGSNDWISFQSEASASQDAFHGLQIDWNRPVVGLLTNVMWDAQLHFEANAFPSMSDWLFSTVDHFLARTDVHLLIRIHPAEVLGTVPSRQKVADLLRDRYGSLPQHISIIEPDDPRNTYLLMERCQAVLVYGTKMAIELPCFGIPTIVAGEAWARNKGFTMDVTSREEYISVLSALPDIAPLDPDQIRLARQYAHYLFFRRMIPLSFAEKRDHLTPVAYRIDTLASLMPGADEGLDCICDGIINLTPFVTRSNKHK